MEKTIKANYSATMKNIQGQLEYICIIHIRDPPKNARNNPFILYSKRRHTKSGIKMETSYTIKPNKKTSSWHSVYRVHRDVESSNTGNSSNAKH